MLLSSANQLQYIRSRATMYRNIGNMSGILPRFVTGIEYKLIRLTIKFMYLTNNINYVNICHAKVLGG